MPGRPYLDAPLRRLSAAGALASALMLSAVLPTTAADPTSAGDADVASGTPRGAPNVTLSRVVSGLSSPLYVTHAGDDRLFVVEKAGRIRIVREVDGRWRVTGTFLDIRGRVGASGGEQGLLGLAFHPDYASNGRFYVDYTDNNGDSVIAEFRRESKGRADPDSFRRVMRINQPFSNHNGGWIGFSGPYLYIAKGDGGGAGDPGDRAQRLNTRLGKILRIDPLDPDGSGPRSFSVPASNPFVGRTGKDVIFHYGLRNPWRVSFDRATGAMWIGDVGQDRYEEVDRTSGAGVNFGWDRLEGRHRYPSGDLCQSGCKRLPILEYRSANGNCSVTGGYVSRRPGASLNGWYVFGDFCSGRIWLISADHGLGDPIGSRVDTSRLISSFGEDDDGRVYVVDMNGSLWRVNGT